MPRKDPEKRKEWWREYYWRTWAKRRELARVNTMKPKTRELSKKNWRKWYEANKEKVKAQRKKDYVKNRARRKLVYHVKVGNLKKEPCFCGEVKVQAHHEDYAKPLEVKWLCIKHHAELRRKLY